MKAKMFFTLASLLLLAFIMAACQKGEAPPAEKKKFTVITTLFPLYDFSRNIAGPRADVSLLLPPGVEPHNFEPKPADMVRIESADVFVYTGPFMEPWVDKLLKGLDRSRIVVVDASAGIALLEIGGTDGEHEHPAKGGRGGKIDPHLWLDFTNAEKMVDNINGGFLQKDPGDRDFFTKNAEAYKAKLRELDGRYRQALSRCGKNVIVQAGHLTFGYLAARYGLKYISAYPGLSPDTEPTPRRLIALASIVKRHGLKVIYYEELMTPRVAEAIAQETGARMLMLNGAHNVSREDLEQGATFLSLMDQNLENLKAGLECR